MADVPEQVFIDAAEAYDPLGVRDFRAAVASAYRAGQAATPDGPRRWALPDQPADVHTVIGDLTGDRYELDDDGNWRDPLGDDFEWHDVLMIEGSLTDATPAADGQDGRDG